MHALNVKFFRKTQLELNIALYTSQSYFWKTGNILKVWNLQKNTWCCRDKDSDISPHFILFFYLSPWGLHFYVIMLSFMAVKKHFSKKTCDHFLMLQRDFGCWLEEPPTSGHVFWVEIRKNNVYLCRPPISIIFY